jgi:hypothetical protein
MVYVKNLDSDQDYEIESNSNVNFKNGLQFDDQN